MNFLRFPTPQDPLNPLVLLPDQSGGADLRSSRQPSLFFGIGSSGKFWPVCCIKPLNPESK
jgi:hypothetical protein